MKNSNWIWWTIGGLTIVGLGVGIFIFVKDKKAKKEQQKTLDVPAPMETPIKTPAKPISKKDDSNFPKWSQQQGDDFRGWVNDKYPAYAKEIDLDRKGSADNSFIRKAWAKYGAEYLKGTTFAFSDNGFDNFMYQSNVGYMDILDENL